MGGAPGMGDLGRFAGPADPHRGHGLGRLRRPALAGAGAGALPALGVREDRPRAGGHPHLLRHARWRRGGPHDGHPGAAVHRGAAVPTLRDPV